MAFELSSNHSSENHSSEEFFPDADRSAQAFARLVEIIARLRAPGGCPWDREQNHLSLRHHLIEEAYEVLDAIEKSDDEALREELGDLLMQPLMHAQIAHEENRFAIADVLDGIADKLVRRHPHVFGELSVADSGEVLRNWDAIKKAEKQQKTSARMEAQAEAPIASILDTVPSALPALSLALEVSKKAAKAGFEWPDARGVLDKLREEIDELEEAMETANQQRISEEIGDLLFTVVNLARWRKVDPELALRDMALRFRTRFSHMENAARMQGVELEGLAPDQWEELWQQAKQSQAGQSQAKQFQNQKDTGE